MDHTIVKQRIQDTTQNGLPGRREAVTGPSVGLLSFSYVDDPSQVTTGKTTPPRVTRQA